MERIKKIKDGQKLSIGDKGYTVRLDEAGKVELLRFNEKYSKLVILKFSDEPSESEKTGEKVIETLSKQYINRIVPKNDGCISSFQEENG